MPEILTYALFVAVFALAGNDMVASSTSARFVWLQHAGSDASSGDESGKGGSEFDNNAYGGGSSDFVGGDGDGEADRGGADSGNSDADRNLTDGEGDNN